MPSRNPGRVKIARHLRQTDVPAEKLLWRELRREQMDVKFRRQHPVGPYFADFASCECMVIFELDGDSHVGKEYEDAERTKFLEAAGWHVIRFSNPEIFDNLDGVVETIYRICEQRKVKPPSP